VVVVVAFQNVRLLPEIIYLLLLAEILITQ